MAEMAEFAKIQYLGNSLWDGVGCIAMASIILLFHCKGIDVSLS